MTDKDSQDTGPGQRFSIHTLENGLTVLGERMPHASSAALAILVPMGAATDPQGEEGAATLLAELYNKGAGPWDSRALSEQFERLGVHRSHSSGIEISVFSGAMLGENLSEAIELFGKMLLEPHLPEAELESVRSLALQDLEALEDQPVGKVMSELAKTFYPHPFGRSQLGTEAGLRAATAESLRAYYLRRFVPSNAVIAVAGKFDWREVQDVVERCFGEWRGEADKLEVPQLPDRDQVHHVQRDTSQLQIALAYPSVTLEHPDYYVARISAGVLSGGMSGRLFVEIREKRGLVYRVSASHSAARKRAALLASAGTTPENAEETLAVMLNELQRLRDGVSEEELSRAKADIKSRLTMQSELSSVRASALINDWWNLGRLRTVQEIKDAIDRVRAEDVARFTAEHPVRAVTLVTLGPKRLELPK